MARNPAFDVTFQCGQTEWLVFNFELSATLKIASISLDRSFDFDIELSAVLIDAISSIAVFDAFKLGLYADFYIQYPKSNWVKWSKIGEFNFTQDRTNLAGEMPMDWPGNIWAIGKLGKMLVVYGSGGITSLQPIDTVFSKSELLNLGVKSKGSILLDLTFHLFITIDGCLWKLSDTLEKLGYEEFLNGMSYPIITYDNVNRLAYICDGTLGYVYNLNSKSLGKGPSKVTGVCMYNNSMHAISSSTLTIPTRYLEVESTDYGNRYFKYITEIALSGDFTSSLKLGISGRNNETTTFSTIEWFTPTSDGRVHPNIGYKEFKLYLQSTDNCTIDSITITGMMADFDIIGKSIYAIGEMGGSLITYDTNSVNIIKIENIFKKVSLLNIGVMSKGAILITDQFHLFITKDGCLWKLDDKLIKLGYKEFLSSLVSPTISYDPINSLVYISDESVGYVYNIDIGSMGRGGKGITDIGYWGHESHILGNTETELQPYLKFNKVDFNNRNFKTITEIEVGGEFEELELGVAFRSNNGSYGDPIWFQVTPEGRSFPNLFAKEVEFHLSSEDALRLDYFNVKGIFADFNPIDG